MPKHVVDLQHNLSSAEELDALVEKTREIRRVADEHGQAHVPNHIPKRERLTNIVLSLALLAYLAWSAYAGHAYVPGKRGRGIDFMGPSLWPALAAMAFAALNLVAVVVDHYDIRPNERQYRRFAVCSQVLAWLSLLVALALYVYVAPQR
jgi:hypothetical protein